MLSNSDIIAIITIGVTFVTFLLTYNLVRYIILFLGMWNVELSYLMTEKLHQNIAIKTIPILRLNCKNKIVIDHLGNYYFLIYDEQEYVVGYDMNDFSGLDSSILLSLESFFSAVGLSAPFILLEWITVFLRGILCLSCGIQHYKEEKGLCEKIGKGISVTIVHIFNPKAEVQVVRFQTIFTQDTYHLAFHNGKEYQLFLHELNIRQYIAEVIIGVLLPNYLYIIYEHFNDSYFVIYLYIVTFGSNHFQEINNTNIIPLTEYVNFLEVVASYYCVTFIFLDEGGKYNIVVGEGVNYVFLELRDIIDEALTVFLREEEDCNFQFIDPQEGTGVLRNNRNGVQYFSFKTVQPENIKRLLVSGVADHTVSIR